ncbi:hypothetical protein BDV93DRAFT_452881, partial [Ceratobasidium sp. AG-I]
GSSCIYHNHMNFHLDEKEPPEGWSPLTVLGDCTTSYLAFPTLGIQVTYIPGHLTFIHGKLLNHGVVGWKGEENRICVANFLHGFE